MSSNYFSTGTLLLYVTVAYIAAYLIYLSKTGHRYIKGTSRKRPLMLLFLMLTAFAVMRKVGFGGMGGMDSYVYEIEFINSKWNAGRYEDMDVLFGYFNIFIRAFTDNVHIYRGICYGIISYGYVSFIKSVCPDNVSSIPFITLMIPYLKSFNTMRTSIAIAVFLIGLKLLYERKKVWANVLIVSTMFIHRMSVIYILFLPFYYLIGKDWERKKASTIIFRTIILMAFGLISAFYVRDYVAAASLLDDHDMHYLRKSYQFSNIVMLLPTFLLIAVWIINVRRLNTIQNEKIKFLEILVAFDCMILPVAAILGMWRANEYLYLPRLSLWGVIILAYIHRFAPKERPLILILFFAIFSGWLVYRIMREWEPCGLMPYLVA